MQSKKKKIEAIPNTEQIKRSVKAGVLFIVSSLGVLLLFLLMKYICSGQTACTTISSILLIILTFFLALREDKKTNDERQRLFQNISFVRTYPRGKWIRVNHYFFRSYVIQSLFFSAYWLPIGQGICSPYLRATLPVRFPKPFKVSNAEPWNPYLTKTFPVISAEGSTWHYHLHTNDERIEELFHLDGVQQALADLAETADVYDSLVVITQRYIQINLSNRALPDKELVDAVIDFWDIIRDETGYPFKAEPQSDHPVIT
jgi:hypothetical protein